MNAEGPPDETSRIAVLVLAYRAPAVLEKNISLFKDSRFRFYVHVDKKAATEKFEFLEGISNTIIIPERFNIFWGGFNMVLAELALLRCALRDPLCERFILISDDCFALRPPEQLRLALQEDVLWIDQYKVNDRNPDMMNRYKNFYYLDSDATAAQFRPPEQRFISLDEMENLNALDKMIRRGKKPLDTLFHGPQWWCLTREAARYVAEIDKIDDHLRASFRFSLVPDEHYIHTIIGNSGKNWRTKSSPMYFDFSREPKPFLFREMGDLDKPILSNRLFVRKLSTDPDLLSMLELAVLKKNL